MKTFVLDFMNMESGYYRMNGRDTSPYKFISGTGCLFAASSPQQSMAAFALPYASLKSNVALPPMNLGALDRKREAIRGLSSGSPTRIRCAPKRYVNGVEDYPQNADLPPLLPKKKKKPFVRPIKELLRESRKAKERVKIEIATNQERELRPPENGLLVPELINVAHEVIEARKTVVRNVLKLMDVIPVYSCRYCDDVHVGSVANHLRGCQGKDCSARRSMHDWIKGSIDDILVPIESYHLFDRLRSRVKHDQRFFVERVPAVVELCIQAGVDIPSLPTFRRTEPITVKGGRTFDPHKKDVREPKFYEKVNLSPELDPCGIRPKDKPDPISPKELKEAAETALEAWERMKQGVMQLMKRYRVRACGYCPEIQVGPTGNRVRLCGTYKHQWRDGKHGWQEASIDDLIPPKFVWHVKDPNGPPLRNELKRFYGKAPALVELCVQAGADIPNQYRPLMRLDVVIPDFEEYRLTA